MDLENTTERAELTTIASTLLRVAEALEGIRAALLALGPVSHARAAARLREMKEQDERARAFIARDKRRRGRGREKQWRDT